MNTTARFFLILAFCAWLTAACQQSATPLPIDPTKTSEPTPVPTETSEPTAAPQLDPEIEELGVYRALLENDASVDFEEHYLIMDHTMFPGEEIIERDLAVFLKDYPMPQEMIDNFYERNRQSYLLEPGMDIGVSFQLITQEEVDELRPLDEASGWKLFYEKYPNSMGFTKISRVGFNEDLSQALVYTAVYHYDRGLQGGLYWMIRQDGTWKIERGMEWMS